MGALLRGPENKCRIQHLPLLLLGDPFQAPPPLQLLPEVWPEIVQECVGKGSLNIVFLH